VPGVLTAHLTSEMHLYSVSYTETSALGAGYSEVHKVVIDKFLGHTVLTVDYNSL
jgi:hypothetical protein